MKITKRQLRRIIKEAMTSDVDYQFEKAFEQMHAFGAGPSDISDMEEIRDLYYEDLPKGEASPYLKRLAGSVDTIIREKIPQDVYYWIFPNL